MSKVFLESTNQAMTFIESVFKEGIDEVAQTIVRSTKGKFELEDAFNIATDLLMNYDEDINKLRASMVKYFQEEDIDLNNLMDEIVNTIDDFRESRRFK